VGRTFGSFVRVGCVRFECLDEGDLKNDFPGQSEEVLVIVKATQVAEDKEMELSVDSTKETKFWKRETRNYLEQKLGWNVKQGRWCGAYRSATCWPWLPWCANRVGWLGRAGCS
jgi:hypothetical protein